MTTDNSGPSVSTSPSSSQPISATLLVNSDEMIVDLLPPTTNNLDDVLQIPSSWSKCFSSCADDDDGKNDEEPNNGDGESCGLTTTAAPTFFIGDDDDNEERTADSSIEDPTFFLEQQEGKEYEIPVRKEEPTNVDKNKTKKGSNKIHKGHNVVFGEVRIREHERILSSRPSFSETFAGLLLGWKYKSNSFRCLVDEYEEQKHKQHGITESSTTTKESSASPTTKTTIRTTGPERLKKLRDYGFSMDDVLQTEEEKTKAIKLRQQMEKYIDSDEEEEEIDEGVENQKEQQPKTTLPFVFPFLGGSGSSNSTPGVAINRIVWCGGTTHRSSCRSSSNTRRQRQRFRPKIL